jgi:hypothetical protein
VQNWLSWLVRSRASHETGPPTCANRATFGLYRDEPGHSDSPDKGLAELIVLKKRQFGDDVGTTRRLVWVGESSRDYAYQGVSSR